jgi:transcriptional regulator with XRE-family HTH domain
MNPNPNRIREWRHVQGWSLQRLAEASGTTKSQIDKLEKGERRLTVDWMVRLAKPLGRDPRDLLPKKIAAFDQIDFGSDETAPLVPLFPPLPVRGTKRGDKKKGLFFTGDQIDQVARPHYLAHVRDAYAMYVVDLSMAPMYRPGQLLFINPYKPPKQGNGIVILLKTNEIKIKEYVGEKKKGLIVREYAPQKRDSLIPHDAIQSIHAVAGATEPQ